VAYRIYIDESGTHEESPWLLIGMLFAPDHATLHNALCAAKDREGYFNTSPKRSAKYREFHFKEVSSPRDVRVGKAWIDTFLSQRCHFRALAFDWSMWNGRYFGDAFEPDTLKKRRAYKKWCELLLQPELSDPLDAVPIRGAELFLDHLRIAYGYDVIDHLRDRFSPPEHYQGSTPYLARLEHTHSWRDANQCLQLTDLLLGALKQSFETDQKASRLGWANCQRRSSQNSNPRLALQASAQPEYHHWARSYRALQQMFPSCRGLYDLGVGEPTYAVLPATSFKTPPVNGGRLSPRSVRPAAARRRAGSVRCLRRGSCRRRRASSASAAWGGPWRCSGLRSGRPLRAA
jgi:hypothetical protein